MWQLESKIKMEEFEKFTDEGYFTIRHTDTLFLGI